MPRSVWNVLGFLAAMGSPAAVSASTYYVGPSGADGRTCGEATHVDTPRRTLSSALRCVASGDTLELLAGTYAESINYENLFPQQSGTSYEQATIVRAHASDRVVIAGIALNSPGSGLSRSYVVFQNLIVEGSSVNLGGGSNGGDVHHIKLDGVEVHDSPDIAITLGGADASGHHLWLTHVKVMGGGENRYDHCWYVEGSDNLIEYSECSGFSGYGVHNYSYPPVYPSRNVYRYNLIHGAGRTEGTTFGLLLTTGNDNVAYNNLVVGNTNGISIGGGSGNHVFNNIVYENGVGARACTAFGDYCYSAIVVGGTGSQVNHNIVFGNALDVIDAPSGSDASIHDNRFEDPLFVDPQAGDYRLQAGSTAIDAGAPLPVAVHDLAGVDVPQGGGVDIGAYERSSGSPSVEPTTFPSLSLTSATTATAPVIDGVLAEPVWSQAQSISFHDSDAENAVRVSALWDSTSLYLAYAVTDASIEAVDDGDNLWRDDGTELFLDTAHDGGLVLDADDFHLIASVHDLVSFTRQDATAVQGVLVRTVIASPGFTQEIAIPWSALGATPSPGVVLGLLLGQNDRDGGSVVQLDWQDGLLRSSYYGEPSRWGTLVLDASVVGADECTSCAPEVTPSPDDEADPLPDNAEEAPGAAGPDEAAGTQDISSSGCAAASGSPAWLALALALIRRRRRP